jgi:hypothetical protein
MVGTEPPLFSNHLPPASGVWAVNAVPLAPLNVSWTYVAAKAAPGKATQRKNTKEKLRMAAPMIFWGIVMRIDGDGLSDPASTVGEASIKGESSIVEASALASRAVAL